MVNTDAELIRSCAANGRIDLAHGPIGIRELEIILTVLSMRSDLIIENSGGAMSLIELGAYLIGIESKESKQ